MKQGRSIQSAQPVEGVYQVDQGTAVLERDPDLANGWLLRLNGVQSSHIDLDDPGHLSFEYMRWIAALVEDRWPAGTTERVRLLHLGGAACSLARYFHHTHPESRQVVVELDAALAAVVREWFGLPRAPFLRLRVGEAREVTESLSPASRDVIIRDVFTQGGTPAPLTTQEFAAHAARVLGPDGIYMVNCGSAPDLREAREDAAGIASIFPHVAIVADAPMLKGRRYGNVIIAGSHRPFEGSAAMVRTLLGGAVPARYLNDDEVREFIRGAQPRHDPAPVPGSAVTAS
ncbi:MULTISPECIES: fused MFS/spermidine synthase [Arthrobacter]|uniref:Fused MFS/spermidine synthase n=2 Tax=Arthrobacter TaxID=1663 RepID=A0ABU9KI85_9MICC|nr:fused MFS/spermidine synthase [Arthrobacter sp. YJM1]MDP5226385.1 fused MFS/spermidine synthase [Arthrobacter sp. YJM1]